MQQISVIRAYNKTLEDTTCPTCAQSLEIREFWEDKQRDGIATCPNCHKDFIIHVHVHYSYSTESM